MSDQTSGPASGASKLPDAPNLEWLRKQAKRRLEELRQSNPDAKLAAAQFDVARQYGFSSWRALKAHIDSLTVDGQLVEGARSGDVATLSKLLDEHPDKLGTRADPYGWTLLHFASHRGHVAVVDVLLRRGLDVNVREQGDNTYAMHWAAAAGHLEIVRRLADAGGDVVGHGDDHELEVIGWATCWEGCDDDVHRAIAAFLVSRGARHHIFSAIAHSLTDEVRRIVADDPRALRQTMSRNEYFQLPLHFAVKMKLPRMAALLLELGADPLAADGVGYPPMVYATTPEADRPVVEALRARGPTDLLTAVALGDWDAAARLVREAAGRAGHGATSGGVLHIMAKRNDVAAVRWLLDHGVDPNGRWRYFDADLVPLHLAILHGHVEVVRLLLRAGADTTIRDPKHNGDAMGWADHVQHAEIIRILTAHASGASGA